VAEPSISQYALVSHVLLSPDLIREVLVKEVQVEYAMAGPPGHFSIDGRDRPVNLAPENADQRVSRPPRLTQQWTQLLGRPIEDVWWAWFAGPADDHVRQLLAGIAAGVTEAGSGAFLWDFQLGQLAWQARKPRLFGR
jgi:hypothetical protein